MGSIKFSELFTEELESKKDEIDIDTTLEMIKKLKEVENKLDGNILNKELLENIEGFHNIRDDGYAYRYKDLSLIGIIKENELIFLGIITSNELNNYAVTEEN